MAAAKSYEADALVLGGDIAGKGLVPIRAENGTLSAEVRGENVVVPRAEEERLLGHRRQRRGRAHGRRH